MGVSQQPLEQRSNDARGRPALPHHHRHDTGTQVSQCVSLFPVRNTLCDSDMSLSLQINRIVAMKLCEIGTITGPTVIFSFLFIQDPI